MNALRAMMEWPILLAVVLILSVGTYARNDTWRSDLSLWQDCLKKAIRSPSAADTEELQLLLLSLGKQQIEKRGMSQ